MDIWGWFNTELDSLYESEPDLARKLDSLAHATTQKNHAYIDAIVPELVATTRSQGHVWMEIFVRHWWLQSKVARRFDVEGALSEAVDLLERAHRPDAEGCPQAICVTQDLCIAYGMIDGPGFAEERLKAAEETLAKIDPNWPCWRCISSEAATALHDAGRHQEAIDYLARSNAASRQAGTDSSPYNLIDPYLELGLLEQALEQVENREILAEGEFGRDLWAIDRSRVLARLEEYDEAMDLLPDWRRLEDTAGLFWPYSDALAQLIRVGMRDWDVPTAAQVAHMVSTLRRHGAWEYVFRVTVLWAETLVAAAEVDGGTAALLARRAREAQSHLQDPSRVEARLIDLEEEIERVRIDPWEGDPETIEQALNARLQEESETEDTPFALMDKASRTLAQRPVPESLVSLVATFWRHLGFHEEAITVYHDARRRNPGSPELFTGLVAVLVDAKDWSALEELLDGLPANVAPELARPAQWYRSVLFELRDGDLSRATALMQDLRDQDPAASDAVPARLAQLREQVGEHEAALELWTLLENRYEEEEVCPWHWERMACATRLDRWQEVRSSAIRQGLPVEPGDEPIDEEGGPIRLLDMDSGESMWAMRTGPVTARILSITGPGRPERFHEVVEFNPQPLNSPPETTEEEDADEAEALLFPVTRSREESTYRCFPWDGPRPEEEDFDIFVEAVGDLGGAALKASSEQYEQSNPDTGEALPALWIRVAVPYQEPGDGDESPSEQQASGQQVSEQQQRLEALESLFAAVAQQVGRGQAVWPELLNALGREEEAQRHRVLQMEWGME